ncbi:ketopantoate reductase family protein [Bacillus oleivorans]|uniref:ketopantoate reductase family protein n=1 Tax=Bacillus oleivorans TaxID=1448271 RepID=UPI000BE33A02|nr:ketopantoate reductase family protein [Bacillus oleivorans]
MKILVVGAGAVGGYFGGRLLEKGEDVTFQVREKRKQQLEERGLKVESINGNFTLRPKIIVAGESVEPYDVILVSTKAYHLDGVLDSIEPYVGDSTMILPLLNGIAHVEVLQKRFGIDRVIGGLCFVESTLDVNGTVIQKSPSHDLVFGELSGEQTERILKLDEAFSGTKANIRRSDTIVRDMWHKYIFITTMSGVTSLMRAPIGPIRETVGGQDTLTQFISEIVQVTRSLAAPVAENIETITLDRVNQLGYEMKSSMQRDMEKGLPTEADHLQGYLFEAAGQKRIKVPLLQMIYGNLKVYENSRNQG